jgi:hypothetical protein
MGFTQVHITIKLKERTKSIGKAQQITITNQNWEGANGIKASPRMWNPITPAISFDWKHNCQ